MFVSGGENIFPGEVEALLARHPAVHQAMVMPFDHELKGQVPYAFIVRKPGTAVTEEDIKQFALTNGPAYQHPRRVFFLEQFPLAGTNKVDREALRRVAACVVTSDERRETT
jgi:acyl-CoA synthetase (AMP-forming)/AMP-acid ligase II